MSKPKQMLDAVKTATAIHNGDYSSLRGKSFLVCDSIENNKGRDTPVKKPSKEKMTLTKLAEQMNARFDNLENDFNKKINQVAIRLDRVENRLDQVEQRLDQVEQRLDRVENRLDQIEQRLDYNGLKQLPNSK